MIYGFKRDSFVAIRGEEYGHFLRRETQVVLYEEPVWILE